MKANKTIHNYFCSCLFIFYCSLIALLPNSIIAQDIPCANEIFQNLLFTDSTYHTAFNDVNQRIDELKQKQRLTANTILEIPVVVHVFHLGEPVGIGTNISDAQIIDAIRGANERWRKITSTGVDMEVQFCLAQFDPNGNPSTGIVRKDASNVPNYSQYGISYIGALGQPGADETNLKNQSNWNHSYVYNIWVVNKIAGNWAGYAFFPFGFNYATDGTVITSSSIRYSSSTLAHELGHGMGLFHTFQGSEVGCAPNDLCFIQGDWVCDTPPHKQTECAPATNNCARNTADSLLNLSFSNIMSYCGVRNLFTQGQKTRVRDVIMTTTRKQLLSSYACSGWPCDTAYTNISTQTCHPNEVGMQIDTLQTITGCDSIIKIITSLIEKPIATFSFNYTNDSIKFNNQSQQATSYEWYFGDDSTSTENSPTHVYSNNGNYNVTLIAKNDCSADTITQVVSTLVTTSIRNNKNVAALIIYPNPTNNNFNIEIDITDNNTYIEIVNTLGQIIYNKKMAIGKFHTITLPNNITKGIYQISVKREKEILGTNLISVY